MFNKQSKKQYNINAHSIWPVLNTLLTCNAIHTTSLTTVSYHSKIKLFHNNQVPTEYFIFTTVPISQTRKRANYENEIKSFNFYFKNFTQETSKYIKGGIVQIDNVYKCVSWTLIHYALKKVANKDSVF